MQESTPSSRSERFAARATPTPGPCPTPSPYAAGEPDELLPRQQATKRLGFRRRRPGPTEPAGTVPPDRARVADAGHWQRPRRLTAQAAEPPTRARGRLRRLRARRSAEKIVVTASMPQHAARAVPQARGDPAPRPGRIAASSRHGDQRVPSEGKTLTATNLALTLSESYQRKVLLIDADLRRPSLHEAFQVPSVTGLSDGLTESERPQARASCSSRPADRCCPEAGPTPDPMSILSVNRMKKMLAEARRELRLGDPRHAARRPAARREPAGGHGGCGPAGRARRPDAATTP